MRMASSASWVTTIEVARVSCRMASVSSRIFSLRRGSSPENGSSISSTLGRGRDGAGKRHALLLAARQDMRIFAGVMRQPDPLQRGVGLGAWPRGG